MTPASQPTARASARFCAVQPTPMLLPRSTSGLHSELTVSLELSGSLCLYPSPSSPPPFCFVEIGFLCSFEACPGTHFVDQAGPKLTEIRLLLPPEGWD